ncbi:MAG: DcaP family trimeric outer membrane transporter, partial [Pseudomonadota bacterium]
MLALAVAAAIGPATAVADGDDVQALQDRVAQLEAMVRELVADRAETRGEIRRIEAEAEAAVDRKVAAAVEEMKPDDDDPSHSYKFGGYIKSDFIMSRYSDGDLPPGNLGRDFYIPGLTPVGGADESTHADFHARESRIYFRSDHVLDNGFKIGTYLEMDFLVTENGNERISNSYSPRMRHAFIKTDKWLAGQTWSTFQNVGALAENIDFVGPAEGTVFERQAMVRYTTGPWQFAIENPETTLTPFGGGGRIVTDDGAFPDLVARYEAKGDWGNFVIAGLYRQLDFEDPASGIDADEAS